MSAKRIKVALAFLLVGAAVFATTMVLAGNDALTNERDDGSEAHQTSWWWQRTEASASDTRSDERDVTCAHPFLPAEQGTHLEYLFEGADSTFEVVLECVRVTHTSIGATIRWRGTIRGDGRDDHSQQRADAALLEPDEPPDLAHDPRRRDRHGLAARPRPEHERHELRVAEPFGADLTQPFTRPASVHQ